jgi:hypothetical protein
MLLASSRYQSLTHTDLTSFNLMMEGSSTPDHELTQNDNLSFLDMQTTMRVNPLVDLGFIIHYAADSKGFSRYPDLEDRLIAFYHTALVRHGINSLNFTLEDCHRLYPQALPLGFLRWSCWSGPLVFLNKEGDRPSRLERLVKRCVSVHEGHADTFGF